MGGQGQNPRPQAGLLDTFAEECGDQEKGSTAKRGPDAAAPASASAPPKKVAKPIMSISAALAGLSEPQQANPDAFKKSRVFGEDEEDPEPLGKLDWGRSGSRMSDYRAKRHWMSRVLGVPHAVVNAMLKCHLWVHRHVESLKVQVVIFLVILFDLVFVLWQSNTDHDIDPATLSIIEVTVLAILTLDILVRMLVQGTAFFGTKLNLFEVAVVLLCVSQSLFSESKLVASFTWLRGVGRAAKFSRPIITTCQHRHAVMSAVRRTAQQKIFDKVVMMIGDCVRVRSEDVHVDPVGGTFQLDHAEIRAETFEDLHSPITIYGGVVQHFKVQVPTKLMFGGHKNHAGLLIKIQLCNAELILGPVHQKWTHAGVMSSKGRLIELFAKRSEVLAPLIKQKGQAKAVEQAPAQGAGQPAAINAKVNRMQALKKELIKQMMHHLLHDMSLEITNVCVRFESEKGEISGLPFVCGMGLRSLTYSKSAPLQSGGSMDTEDCMDSTLSTRRLPQLTASTGFASASITSKMLKRTRSLVASATTSLRRLRSSRSNRTLGSRTAGTDVAHDGQKLTVDQFEIYWDVHHGNNRHLTRRVYKAIDSCYSRGDVEEASLMAAEAQRKFVANRAREAMKLRAIGQIITKFSGDPQKSRLMSGPMFRERFDEHYYVLFPVNACVRMEWRHGFAIGEPPKVVALTVDPMRWAVDDRQVVSMNQSHAFLSRWLIENQCCVTRPAQRILTTDEIGGMRQIKSSRQLANLGLDGDGTGSTAASAPSAETLQKRHDLARRWWQHAMRCCQIRLDFKTRLVANRMARYAADEVQGEYVDLVTQTMFKEQLSQATNRAIHERLLELQVPMNPVVCLRLRQIAKDEVRRLKKQAMQADVFDNINDEKDQAELMKEKAEKVLTQFGGFARLGHSPSFQEESLEDEEDVDDVLDELVAAEPAEAQPSPIGSTMSRMSSNRDIVSAVASLRSVTGVKLATPRGTKSMGELETPALDNAAADDGEADSALDLEANELAISGEDSQIRAPIELTLSVKSVEVFVLSHSLWGAILKAEVCHPQVPPDAHQQSVRSSSAKSSPVGGFGFERFGAHVMPRNMVASAGVSTVAGHLSVAFDAFDRGCATGSEVSLSVKKIYGYTPLAPSAFQGILEFDTFESAKGEHVCMEMRLQAVEKPPDDEAFSTLRSEALTTLKSEAATVKSAATAGTLASNAATQPSEVGSSAASLAGRRSGAQASSNTAAASSVALASKDQRVVRGVITGVGQVAPGSSLSAEKSRESLGEKGKETSPIVNKAPEPDQEPPKKVGAIWAVKALQKAHWDGTLRTSPMRATCFEPVMQRLLSMAKEGRRQNQAREEFEIQAQLGHRREQKLSLPAKLFLKLQRFCPGSVCLQCDIGSMEMNAVLRYAFKEVVSIQATLPKLLPRVLVGGKPMQISLELACGSLPEQAAGQEGELEAGRQESLDADNDGLWTSAAQAQSGLAKKLQSYKIVEERTVLLPQIAGGIVAQDSASLASSRGSEQNCLVHSNWRDTWHSLWCAWRGEDDACKDKVVDSVPALSVDPPASTAPGIHRKGADAVAWATYMTRSARNLSRQGPLSTKIEIEDDAASDWADTLPLASMMRQLPWSLKVRTMKSTSVGLAQGNFMQKSEDYHFLDPASRAKLRCRNLLDNASKVYEVIRKSNTERSSKSFPRTPTSVRGATLRQLIQEEVEDGVEGCHVPQDDIEVGNPLKPAFDGSSGANDAEEVAPPAAKRSGTNKFTNLSFSILDLEAVRGAQQSKQDSMLDLSKEMDAILRSKSGS